jgi:glutamyl-tRNA(Gln) amidotransferase subunit D
MILHCGGTIASRVDYRTGGTSTSFNPEDLLTLFPELGNIANIDSRLIRNMWSEDLRFKHVGLIADEIAKEANKEGKEKPAGIIVGIGTDNLASAAAGVAFALEECTLPVIFVGSQRSSDRGSSDAASNLISAAKFIVDSDFAGVAICMHSSSEDSECSILPACKTRKLHSTRRDAFKAVNTTEIARVSYPSGKINFIQKDYKKITSFGENAKTISNGNFEEKVAIQRAHVNMFPEQFDFYLEKKYAGLIIDGTGVGLLPGHAIDEWTREINPAIFKSIKRLVDNGCVVGMTTQCVFGRVELNIYDKGRDIQCLGVISCEDMLAETALMKLSWLLANKGPAKAKELLGKNLRGEITPFTRYDSALKEDKKN